MNGFNCCSGIWVKGYAEVAFKAKEYAVQNQVTVVVYLKEGQYFFISEADWVRTEGVALVNAVTPYL